MSAPDRIYFNGGLIPDHMYTSLAPYAGGKEYLRATPAREHAEELAEALREVKRDCECRAVKNVVPIGRSAWDGLCAALAKLEKEEGK